MGLVPPGTPMTSPVTATARRETIVSDRAPYGRPRAELPDTGTARIQVTLPASMVRTMYDQASAERRPLSSIAGEALTLYYAKYPPETWRHIG